jgi:hypothetical protein
VCRSGGSAAAYGAHLNASGFSFLVHPQAFVVHVPHVRTKRAARYLAQSRANESATDALRARAEAEAAAGRYLPVSRLCGGAQQGAQHGGGGGRGGGRGDVVEEVERMGGGGAGAAALLPGGGGGAEIRAARPEAELPEMRAARGGALAGQV